MLLCYKLRINILSTLVLPLLIILEIIEITLVIQFLRIIEFVIYLRISKK